MTQPSPQTAIAELKVDLSLAIGDEVVEVDTEVLKVLLDAVEAIHDRCIREMGENTKSYSPMQSARADLAETLLNIIDGE